MVSDEDKLLTLFEEIGAKRRKRKVDDEKSVELLGAMLSLFPPPRVKSKKD